MNLESLKHLKIMLDKRDRTVQHYQEQMIEGKIFTKVKPFDVIEELQGSIADFFGCIERGNIVDRK